MKKIQFKKRSVFFESPLPIVLAAVTVIAASNANWTAFNGKLNVSLIVNVAALLLLELQILYFRDRQKITENQHDDTLNKNERAHDSVENIKN